MNHKFWYVAVVLTFLSFSCGVDMDNRPSSEERWPESGRQREVSEPVPIVERTQPQEYGLPQPGKRSIADLIALLPAEDVSFGPNYFPWGRQPLECLNDRTIRQEGDSFTFEGVVTIPGTYYVKSSICDQEERFYGSFVVEDDTGGILVLRDSRVAQVQPGDVVEITVHSAVLVSVYSFFESRAIYSYDMVIKPERKPVLFETLTTPFDETHIGETKRVTGYPLELPSNLNFSTMVLTDQEFPRTDFEATLELAVAACAEKSSAAACEYAEVVCTPDGTCSERVNEDGQIRLQSGICETRQSDATLVCSRGLPITYADCIKSKCPASCEKANCQGSDGGNRCRKNPYVGTPLESFSQTVCAELGDGDVCKMPSGLCKEKDRSTTVTQCDSDQDCIADRSCVVQESGIGLCQYACPEVCGDGTSCGPGGTCVPKQCQSFNDCNSGEVCTSEGLCVQSSGLCNGSDECTGLQTCATIVRDEEGEAVSFEGRCRFIDGQIQLSCVSDETCDNCRKYVCPELCKNHDPGSGVAIEDYLTDTMPICWEAGLNQELVRRGYDLNGAQRIEITGPVLRGFGDYSRKIAAERLGQVEVLWSEEYE